jgi:hypothetical protein
MTDKSNDPIALWQKMISEMGKGFNPFATRTTTSPESGKTETGSAGAGPQRQVGDFMEKYLVSMNMPSRAQLAGLTERLQTIENQLNEIKGVLVQMSAGIDAKIDAKIETKADAPPAPAPRPPRAKRSSTPPSEAKQE